MPHAVLLVLQSYDYLALFTDKMFRLRFELLTYKGFETYTQIAQRKSWGGSMRGRLFFIFILLPMILLLPQFALGAERLVIHDMIGRRVEIPKEPKRIVALGGTLRYVVYLQALDLVVGVEGVEKEEYMKGMRATGRPYHLAIRDRVRALPVVGEGGPGKLPDLEKLLMVRPDLVIVAEQEQAKVIEERLKIPTVVLRLAGPDGWTFDELKEVLKFVGRLLNREKRANELVREIDQFLADIRTRTRGISTGPTVYVGAVSMRGSHGIVSSHAGFPPFELLKAKNVVDEVKGKGHVFIDKERLLAWNPEFIFIDSAGLPLVREDFHRNMKYYQALRAFNEGKVYTLFPINFYRTNPELVMINTYFIGKVLYPKAFKDIDPESKGREILKKFLGVDVLDEIRKDFPGFKRVYPEGGHLHLK